MTDLRIPPDTPERAIQYRIEHLDKVDFICWLHDARYRVVYVEHGYLVLFDHRQTPPTKWICNWKFGRRKATEAHYLAVQDVLEKIRLMEQQEKVA